MPNVLSQRDLVFRPDNMDETVPHTLSNAVVQNFNDFLNKRGRERENERMKVTVVFVLNRMKNN